MSRYIFFDTETSGTGNNARVIQFSAIITDENLVVTDAFDEYCMIDGDIPPEVLQIHGIDKNKLAKLSGGQTILDVVEKHKDILRGKGNVWVGYNTPFDIRKIQDSIDSEKIKVLNEEVNIPEYLLNPNEPIIDFGSTVMDEFPNASDTRNVNYDLMRYYYKKLDLKVWAKLGVIVDDVLGEEGKAYAMNIFENSILSKFTNRRKPQFHDALFDAFICWFLFTVEKEDN
ncbi:MAG: 3'-5' exonuclease [Clostridium perfringens]|nr:3'-5' exonuclease [Clostridium perfringens]